MSGSAPLNPPLDPALARDGSSASWTLHLHEVLPSTNEAAASLPPWNAVRAARQTAGRGRHQRAWISDSGGLWLSAVVPTGAPDRGWAALPLAVGLVVCEALAFLGVAPVHLRWPNDVMVADRKLAGLLVEQFQPGCAVIGMGINVTNRPEAHDPSLQGEVARLADFMTPAPGLDALMFRLLEGIRGVVTTLHQSGFEALVSRVNAWWRPGVIMELETQDDHAVGHLLGVDELGRLRILGADGQQRLWDAHQVVRARERREGTS